MTATASLQSTSSPPHLPESDAELPDCILFFDGVCGLCNGVVNMLMALDPCHRFHFAPLQGTTAARLLGPQFTQNLSTMVIRVRGENFTKSAAVVRVLWNLSLGWKVMGSLLWLIPKPLRDLAYTLVARNRYWLFGKHETCRMPTPAERALFLD